jgi:hypothetical protein
MGPGMIGVSQLFVSRRDFYMTGLADYMAEHRRAADAADKLSDAYHRAILKGANDDTVLELLRPVPEAVLNIGYQFAALAAYGYFKSYAHVLAAQFRTSDALFSRKFSENGHYNSNTTMGGYGPVSWQTDAARRLVSDLSYGMSQATATHFGEQRLVIPVEQASANVVQVLQEQIAPRVYASGADPALAFCPGGFDIHSHYAIAAALRQLSPKAFDFSHAHSETLAISWGGDHKSKGALAFFDTLRFQQDHGHNGIPKSQDWLGRVEWPEDAPIMVVTQKFYGALEAGNPEAAQVALAGYTLRPSLALSFIGQALRAGYPELILPVFDATKAFNSAALASHLLSGEVATAFFVAPDAQPDGVRDKALLKAVGGLQLRHGDINAGGGRPLMTVALFGRMDIARKLMARGASAKTAMALALDEHKRHANNIHDEGYGPDPKTFLAAHGRLQGLFRRPAKPVAAP